MIIERQHLSVLHTVIQIGAHYNCLFKTFVLDALSNPLVKSIQVSSILTQNSYFMTLDTFFIGDIPYSELFPL